MEPLWSPAVATGRSRWQTGRPRKRLGQAQTVAVGCDRLPERFHGKEGVDGSSPSEGFAKAPQIALFLSARLARAPVCGRYGAAYGAFSLETSPGKRQTGSVPPGSAPSPERGWATTALVRRSCRRSSRSPPTSAAVARKHRRPNARPASAPAAGSSNAPLLAQPLPPQWRSTEVHSGRVQSQGLIPRSAAKSAHVRIR
jgi:hypothetical protein